MLVPVVPSTCTILDLALQLLLHHLLSFLFSTLGLCHQQMQPSFPLHLLHRWREYYSSILEHITHLSSPRISWNIGFRKLLHLFLWDIDNHLQVSPREVTHAHID